MHTQLTPGLAAIPHFFLTSITSKIGTKLAQLTRKMRGTQNSLGCTEMYFPPVIGIGVVCGPERVNTAQLAAANTEFEN